MRPGQSHYLPAPGTCHARILVVDDEPANRLLLDGMLRACGYDNLLLEADPRRVVEHCRGGLTDLLLLDINMPELDGFGVLAALRQLDDPLLPPVLVLTAQHDRETLIRALSAGARDFVTKPFDHTELLVRVKNLLQLRISHRMLHDKKELLEAAVRERTAQLRATRLQVVQRLGRAAEFRDNETGYHIQRMSRYSALLAGWAGWDAAACELILHASPMHDVGKIGIPDQILLKPGTLSPQEWETMKSHTLIGARLLGGDDSDLLRLARTIALTHHEKWDGSGYPHGLHGERIPLAGRIVAIADVFDALASKRVYKEAWPLDEVVNYLEDQAGGHFDPGLVELFLAGLPEILEVRARYADPGPAAHGTAVGRAD